MNALLRQSGKHCQLAGLVAAVLEFPSNYRFRNATEDEKSELLKDILALANAWKATDGSIIIGVEETNGKATNVCGVAPELNDSAVQQFVNSKTNRPVAFAVEHAEH